MNYQEVLAKIPLSQAFPYTSLTKLKEYVYQVDEDGYYIAQTYTPFCFIHDN